MFSLNRINPAAIVIPRVSQCLQGVLSSSAIDTPLHRPDYLARSHLRHYTRRVNEMPAPLHRTVSLPASVSDRLSRFKLFVGAASKDEVSPAIEA